jgi:PDZ domain-containing protein
VLGLAGKSASQGKLRPGDAIVSVAGSPADSYPKLRAILEAKSPGTTVPVVVTRAGKRISVPVTLGPAPKGAHGGSLGISVPQTSVCLTPYTVDLGLGNEIGGPSAGLMFALGIMDKVGHTDLTDGRFIAGTGTISPDGKVGPIGGIQLKMIAARDKGASVFLAPADNCADVRGATPSGLQVVKVSTLHEAVGDLAKLENKQSVPGC